MNYPSDFTEDMRKIGICGVLAIAVATDSTMAEAHAACARNLMPHQKRHVRNTYDGQIENSIKELGKQVFTVETPKMNLARWEREYGPERNRTYVLFINGHVMTYRNGDLMDQEANCSIYEHPRRRCFVKKVMEIF